MTLGSCRFSRWAGGVALWLLAAAAVLALGWTGSPAQRWAHPPATVRPRPASLSVPWAAPKPGPVVTAANAAVGRGTALPGQRALAWLSSTVALQFITVCTALASVAMVAVSFARRQTTWSLAAMDSEGQSRGVNSFDDDPYLVSIEPPRPFHEHPASRTRIPQQISAQRGINDGLPSERQRRPLPFRPSAASLGPAQFETNSRRGRPPLAQALDADDSLWVGPPLVRTQPPPEEPQREEAEAPRRQDPVPVEVRPRSGAPVEPKAVDDFAPSNLDQEYDFPMRRRWLKTCPPAFEGDLAMANIIRFLREKRFTVVMEVRDARAPETCSHPLINKVCEQVPVRIICYTHADLLSQADLARVMVWTERIYGSVPIFCLNMMNAKFLAPKDDRNSFRTLKAAMEEACTAANTNRILVTGLPNVGKSSLILPLTRAETLKRRKKQAYHLPHIADVPGETKGTKSHCFKDSKPEMFMVDTPGLPIPNEKMNRDPELYFKLMLMNVNKKSLTHSDIDVADYILWKSNRARRFWYVDSMELPGPTDDINVLLRQVVPEDSTTARTRAARIFIKFCQEHGILNMLLDELRLSFGDEARIDRIPMRYDPDQMIVATNWTPGMMMR